MAKGVALLIGKTITQDQLRLDAAYREKDWTSRSRDNSSGRKIRASGITTRLSKTDMMCKADRWMDLRRPQSTYEPAI
uniref:Uncharacterized protein n=1 Tax=Hyaloperonospora arabidopsidis (strain Emoy2) TaxID=559515 RepID=M4C3S1_HYAAE